MDSTLLEYNKAADTLDEIINRLIVCASEIRTPLEIHQILEELCGNSPTHGNAQCVEPCKNHGHATPDRVQTQMA
jgi:hypothetical protein